ncbi:unnamed protein product [Heligmosomoides polygyrus]|uniref:WAP domain-containing protein n=1 Tax=Heligmosomoides polygyrus TaxID=6339 RepID=A0A183GKA2_HELPZ|nr:unnamed protein product [Heligmosomoides polygyrus]
MHECVLSSCRRVSQMRQAFTLTVLCLVADLGYSYPDDIICYRNWYFDSPRPAPRRCPPSDLFSYFECCGESDGCCRRLRDTVACACCRCVMARIDVSCTLVMGYWKVDRGAVGRGVASYGCAWGFGPPALLHFCPHLKSLPSSWGLHPATKAVSTRGQKFIYFSHPYNSKPILSPK